MQPRTADEKQLVLARIVRDLKRLTSDAKGADFDSLAFVLAQARDEAQTLLERLEGETLTE